MTLRRPRPPASRFAAAVLLPVCAAAAPAARLTRDDFRCAGWQLSIPALGQSVEIAPPRLVDGSCEGVLLDGEPGWRGPLLLAGPAWAYGALRAETLQVRTTSDPATNLLAGADFALDPTWAAVAARPGSRWPAGTAVRCSYRYALSRLDLLELAPDGTLTVVRGEEDRTEPLLPAPTPGRTPLAGLYLSNAARELTPACINLITPGYDGLPPVLRRARLAPLREALRQTRPVTLVFFGDSITAQQPRDFRDGRGSFVDRFTAHLQRALPRRRVVATKLRETVAAASNDLVVVMSGVGGNDTRRARERLDTDVLTHRPDLVVVMFGVNDENRAAAGNAVPVAEYRANLEAIVDRVRAAGGEPLLMTPSLKNPGWSGTVGNLAAYAQAMRDVAEASEVCLVDAHRAWERLPERGYDPMIYLGNCINHPVDLGHELFFRGLRAAFAEAEPAAAEPPPACACPAGTAVAPVGELARRGGPEIQACTIETGRLHSPAMQRDIAFAVLLPPAYAAAPSRRFGVLYALHGMGAPFATWTEMAPLRRALAEQPMIVVSFDGDRAGWYLDAPERPRSRFTTFFFDELVPWVEQAYRVDPARRGVTGFSMGANGAFHYLLTRPGFFSGVSGLSSGFCYFDEGGREPLPVVEALLGPPVERREAYRRVGIRARFEAAVRGGTPLPPLHLGCGIDDPTLGACRDFAARVTGLGVPLQVAEAPGGHAWPYWRDASPGIIDFHWRCPPR